jgi:DNA repair exonuclease SbcCD ATPase subunit
MVKTVKEVKTITSISNGDNMNIKPIVMEYAQLRSLVKAEVLQINNYYSIIPNQKEIEQFKEIENKVKEFNKYIREKKNVINDYKVIIKYTKSKKKIKEYKSLIKDLEQDLKKLEEKKSDLEINLKQLIVKKPMLIKNEADNDIKNLIRDLEVIYKKKFYISNFYVNGLGVCSYKTVIKYLKIKLNTSKQSEVLRYLIGNISKIEDDIYYL